MRWLVAWSLRPGRKRVRTAELLCVGVVDSLGAEINSHRLRISVAHGRKSNLSPNPAVDKGLFTLDYWRRRFFGY